MEAQKSQKHISLCPFSGGHLNFLAGRSPSAWPCVFHWPGSRQATDIDFWNSPAQSVINTLFLAGLTVFFSFSSPPAAPGLGRCRPPARAMATQEQRVSNSGCSKYHKQVVLCRFSSDGLRISNSDCSKVRKTRCFKLI